MSEFDHPAARTRRAARDARKLGPTIEFCGLWGAGKSEIARKISYSLGLSFRQFDAIQLRKAVVQHPALASLEAVGSFRNRRLWASIEGRRYMSIVQFQQHCAGQPGVVLDEGIVHRTVRELVRGKRVNWNDPWPALLRDDTLRIMLDIRVETAHERIQLKPVDDLSSMNRRLLADGPSGLLWDEVEATYERVLSAVPRLVRVPGEGDSKQVADYTLAKIAQFCL